MDRGGDVRLVNDYADQLLEMQKLYADWTGLTVLKSNLEQLGIEAR